MIEINNLTKKFGKVVAVDNMTVNIKDVSVIGLVGSNGSGKSTLLRMLAGVYAPDGGTVRIDGIEHFDNPVAKGQCFFIPDFPFFYNSSTVESTAFLYRKLYPNWSEDEYNRLCSMFPINRNANIINMSKGMQRQAALILALSCCPKYLLLDEAFDGLDPVMRKVLKSLLIEGIENGGMTAIIASHNLRELEELCDKVGLIHNGKIVFNDSIESLKGNLHKVQIAFERVPDTSVFEHIDVLKIEQMGSLLNIAVRGNADEIESFLRKLNPLFVELLPPTLEEIFMYELEVTGYDVKEILG